MLLITFANVFLYNKTEISGKADNCLVQLASDFQLRDRNFPSDFPISLKYSNCIHDRRILTILSILLLNSVIIRGKIREKCIVFPFLLMTYLKALKSGKELRIKIQTQHERKKR